LNYELWQKNEEENIDGLDGIVDKLESGYKIDLWDIVPEIELGKSKLVWGMLSPESIREGHLTSRPQVFLLPINAPQREGWSFQSEYGHSASWLAELIETCPDRIKPVITAQPLDYKPYSAYDKVFKACREVYGDLYPPCSQWRVDSLIAKYRMTYDEQFGTYFSDKYFRLAKDHWASRVMETLGFDSDVKPNTVEGRSIRHFLAVGYSLASLGLDEVVKHVVGVCSSLHGVDPHKRMNFAWRIMDPYYDYFARPLRSDLAGLHLKEVSESEEVQKLQLILPFVDEDQNIIRKLVRRLKRNVDVEEQQIELVKKLETGASLEFILRLNFILENNLFLPKTEYLEKTVLKDVQKADGEYADHLYQVWRELYHEGKVEQRLLDRLFQLSVNYTQHVQEVAQKRLKRKVKIEKFKMVAGALVSGVAAGYGLSEVWEMSLRPIVVPEAIMWSLETTLSLLGVAQTVRSLISIDEVIREKISEKLRKNIFKGNIVDIEILHSLTA
jgi:hypothetical protein